jgi:outer membrane protein OmpA-like peptidoglycan-associated protein
VRDALIARGVPAERLHTRGFAARRPIADNSTESGRARNRRIEFHALSAN